VHTVHAGTNRIPMRRLPLLFPAAVFLPGGAGFKSWQTDEWQQNATDEAGCSFRMKSLYRESSAATHTHTNAHTFHVHAPPPTLPLHAYSSNACHTAAVETCCGARAHAAPLFLACDKRLCWSFSPLPDGQTSPFFFPAVYFCTRQSFLLYSYFTTIKT